MEGIQTSRGLLGSYVLDRRFILVFIVESGTHPVVVEGVPEAVVPSVRRRALLTLMPRWRFVYTHCRSLGVTCVIALSPGLH